LFVGCALAQTVAARFETELVVNLDYQGPARLARLIEALPGAVQQAAGLPDEQRQAYTPMLAILSAQHETQYSRLFRS